MKEYRCPKCKKLLFKAEISGTVEVKCHNCKKINVFIESTSIINWQYSSFSVFNAQEAK